MKKLLLLLAITASPILLKAQDFPFGQFSSEELDMTRYEKDTTAHALVLREYGKTWISSADGTPLIHEYHVKIKIFDDKAFDRGTIQIPIYKVDNSRFEEVSDIEAITYYKTDNGGVQKAEFDPKQVFHVKENRYWDLIRFALPGLHKGCIIEYKYKLESPLKGTFRTWNFQDYIPKLYSEYEIHIPATYDYSISKRGAFNLTKTTSDLEKECFTPGGGYKVDCSRFTYIVANIPAFVREADMTSPKNYMWAIYFEEKSYYNYLTNGPVKVAQEWRDVDIDLRHADYFGSQIKRSGLMKSRLQTVIAGKTDDLAKAKAVFEYLQKNCKWNGITGFGTDDGIKAAMDNHTGSVADINLTLIAGLNAVGINTEAVLLSTRENGEPNKLYPAINDFNYVIAKANIGDKSYLLDATDPFLPFGLLPLKCINDQGRVINMDKPSYWIDLVASQKKTRTYVFDLTLQEDGKLKGTMLNYSLGYEAYDKRRAIKKFNSVDEYVDDLDTRLKRIKITKSSVQNLDSLDKPLIEQYEITMDGFNLNNSRFSFYPFFMDHISENPYKLPERSYPVDRGAALDDRFTLTLHLPEKYTVETVPQSVALAMPLQGGRFLVDYTPNEDGISYSHITQLNKSIYSAQEYPYLKELYNKIIQSENAEIVIRKK